MHITQSLVRRLKIVVTLLTTLTVTAQTLSHAQAGGSFSILQSTIDTGGSASAGGGFTITGTVGQHDAGTMHGGGFSVEGGFWHGIYLVGPAAEPRLQLRIVGVNAVISWPLSAAGYQLQSCADLNTKNWVFERMTLIDTPNEHTVTLPAYGVVKFFRLKKP